jgi:hypothetical protein
MKKYYFSFLILFSVLAITFTSCQKEFETDNVSRIVKVSYPSIALKGDSIVVLKVGDSYTDAGAILTDDISGAKSDISMEDAAAVDVNTPGFYTVTYRAANANGFETVAYRLVLVTNVSESVDLSGTYLRNTNGAPATWTKIARGLYINDNVGGVAPPSAAVLPVYVGQTTDSTIEVPEQPVPNGYGTLYVTGGELSISAADTSYSYIVVNPGFGTARRTFNKE